MWIRDRLRIHTDEGMEGNAVRGSSVCPATADAGSLIEALPPVLLGQDPLLRGELYRKIDDWRQRRRTTRRAVGAVDIAPVSYTHLGVVVVLDDGDTDHNGLQLVGYTKNI